jgi:hypothetical protein
VSVHRIQTSMARAKQSMLKLASAPKHMHSTSVQGGGVLDKAKQSAITHTHTHTYILTHTTQASSTHTHTEIHTHNSAINIPQVTTARPKKPYSQSQPELKLPFHTNSPDDCAGGMRYFHKVPLECMSLFCWSRSKQGKLCKRHPHRAPGHNLS